MGIMKNCEPQKRPACPATPVPRLLWEEHVPDSKPVSNLSVRQRPLLTTDKKRLKHILALEVKYLLEPSEGQRE